VEIDDHLVADSADIGDEAQHGGGGAETAAAFGEFAPGEEEDVRKGGMASDELGILRGEEPIDAGLGVTAAEFFEDGQCVNDIADSGGLDEQDPGEIDLADVGTFQVNGKVSGPGWCEAMVGEGGFFLSADYTDFADFFGVGYEVLGEIGVNFDGAIWNARLV